MAGGLRKILAELVLFSAAALLSEALRCVVQRRDAELGGGLRVCSLVLAWYSFSITLTLFNKWVVSNWHHDGLEFPIFYTATHMFLKGCFALGYLRCFRCTWPPWPGWKVVWGTSLIGVMTALDIAASNLSFQYISVAFYTMLKSASLLFLFFLGVITCMEPISLPTLASVLVIAGGLFVVSYGEADFEPRGFWLVVCSEVFAAIRWLTTQVMLHGRKLEATVAVLLMSPAATVTLAPVAVVLERHELEVLGERGALTSFILMVMFPGFLAFLLLLVEVQLVKETSSLTMSVFGNLKSIVTIILAVLVFGESASKQQWIGLCLSLGGIIGYSRIRHKSVAVDALAHMGYEQLDQEEEDTPVPASDGGTVKSQGTQAEVVGRQHGCKLESGAAAENRRKLESNGAAEEAADS